MNDNISRLVYGLILGLFSSAFAISIGASAILFLLLLSLVVIGAIRLASEDTDRKPSRALYPLLGILIGIIFVAALSVSPAAIDGFSAVVAYLISLYAVDHI